MTMAIAIAILIGDENRYAEGHLKTVNVESTRKAIASLLEKYRAAGDGKNIVHVVHKTPEGMYVLSLDLAIGLPPVPHLPSLRSMSSFPSLFLS
jgi:hypothetical protein